MKFMTLIKGVYKAKALNLKGESFVIGAQACACSTSQYSIALRV